MNIFYTFLKATRKVLKSPFKAGWGGAIFTFLFRAIFGTKNAFLQGAMSHGKLKFHTFLNIGEINLMSYLWNVHIMVSTVFL